MNKPFDIRTHATRRIAEIEAQLTPLNQELRELRTVLAALDGRLTRRRNQIRPAGPNTIQSAILRVLTDTPGGLHSDELLPRVQQSYGREIERTSVAPQLSRLKADGRVSHSNGLWALVATQPHSGDDA